MMSVRKIARGWAAGLALSASAALSVALPALAAPERVALVIGNAAYQHAPGLANPLNDAADVAAALERVGFSVTSLTDAGGQTLRRGLQAFRRKAAAAKIAAVFYAGHGIEVDKHNYLVPVDAQLQSDGDVEYEAVPLDLVMRSVKWAKDFRLVVLDACRENPFLTSMQREAGSTRSIGRGLARAEPTVGGTLLAYSAKEGMVAADGSGRNSPYTEALLRYLEEPGLEVGLMFRKVRDAVIESTGREQEPFAYGSLSAKGAYFIPPVGLPPDPTDETPGGGAVADGPGMELEYWKSVNAIEDPGAKVAALLAYRERFPAGVYASLADIQLKALRATEAGSGGAEERSPSAGEANLRLTREELRGIQRALAQAGYDPGPADGIVGRGTRGAIGRWQRAQGRSATEYLGPEDAKALLALAPVPGPAVADPPQAGERFRDCDGTWCPWMVVVPAGEYRMGSPSGEAGRDDDEGPRHQVRIAKPFAVGVYEVTFSEWEACVSDGGCGHRPNDEGWGGGTRPVINVSWDDAKAYVRWLSNETGEAYRLLSESKWEYVARAGTQTRYWWGDEVGSGQCRHGNGADGSLKRHYSDWEWATVGCDDGEVHTAPVGQFKANRFELHDVLGNVWEWVEDCWNGSYAGAPADGSAWRSGNCGTRMLRGGSWGGIPSFLRAAGRGRVDAGDRDFDLGFRIARTLD